MSNTTGDKEKAIELECITPILYVKNVAVSVDYYINRLGFKKEWNWGDPPNFASVSRDDFPILLCEGGQGQPGTWLWIGVSDTDAIYDEFKAKGVTFRETPTNYPWAYELRVEDPDGHILRFGS